MSELRVKKKNKTTSQRQRANQYVTAPILKRPSSPVSEGLLEPKRTSCPNKCSACLGNRTVELQEVMGTEAVVAGPASPLHLCFLHPDGILAAQGQSSSCSYQTSQHS